MRARLIKLITLSLYVAVALLFVHRPVHAEQLTVAVASNFLAPLKTLAKQFQQQTGHHLRISAGSTGKLYAQIVNGAPFDVFLAANSREPQRLENEQRIVAGSRFTYAHGQLVLWSPKGKDRGEGLLKNPQIKVLAIANPKTAPYGAAAQQILEQYFGERPPFRVVRGESVGQAFQMIASGAAQAGFVARSQMMSAAFKDQGHLWIPAMETYPAIEQQAVLLTRAKDNRAAQAFMIFLKSAAVQQQLVQRYGYGQYQGS